MNILYIISNPVYDTVPTAGGQTVNYYLSRMLDLDNIKIRIITVGRNNDKQYSKMRDQFEKKSDFTFIGLPFVMSVIRYLYYKFDLKYWLTLFSPSYAQIDFVTRYYIVRYVKKLSYSTWIPSIIILEWPEMLYLAKKVKKLFPNAKVVVSEHDIAFQRYERTRSSKNCLIRKIKTQIYRNLKDCEIKYLTIIDRIIVQSNKDKVLLMKNGISEEKVLIISPFYRTYLKTDYSNCHAILFWGAMNRKENIEAVMWFINNVFKQLKSSKNDFKLVIVGNGGEKILKSLPYREGIKVVGFVSDPSEYFNNCFCLVAPLFHGAGIKVKVLEGMSAGLPVLTNSIGVEGIDAVPGKHYMHCETPKDFIEAIKELVENPEKCKYIGELGRDFIKRNFDYKNDFFKYCHFVTIFK